MAKKDRSVDWLTIKHFWQATAIYKREALLSWLTGFSGLGIAIIVPYFIGLILGSLARPSSNISTDIYILIAASAATVILNRVGYNAFLGLQPKVQAALQTEVLEALLRRGTSFHNNRVSGKLVSDASDYPNAYAQLMGTFFTDIYPFCLSIIIGVTLVFIHSWLLGVIILVMTIVAIVSALHFRHRMTPNRIKRHAAGKVLIGHLADSIVNVQTVKSFGNEQIELARHKVLNDTVRNLRIHDWMELAKDGSYRVGGLLLFQILFVIVVANQVHHNPALLATGIFAFSYTVNLSNRLFQIGTMMRSIEEALLLAMPMTEMLQEDVEVTDKPAARELRISKGQLEFRKVVFFYTDNSKHDKVFSNLSLDIKPGEKVGLVGPSGGGKTTLTKLLLRFEDIQEGAICIDEQNIADVTQVSLRKSIAYVPQEPLLFHRTVSENISYGKPDASEAEIHAAAKLAHANEFISKLPNGYGTVVGERGVKLSGGQRQRIAIARAILKDAPILVLDEATSALDSESEVAIQAALWELMQGRTTVVVAHRLSTIQRMDRIIVLDDGRIVEQGSHAELLKENGLYARLWSHQSGGFIEE